MKLQKLVEMKHDPKPSKNYVSVTDYVPPTLRLRCDYAPLTCRLRWLIETLVDALNNTDACWYPSRNKGPVESVLALSVKNSNTMITNRKKLS